MTPYDMRVGPGGNLTNFLNGQQLSATLSVTPIGDPNDYGTCLEPGTNTPAGALFYGIVDVANTNSVIGVNYGANTAVILTFNNLNPAKKYVFRGTSVRGGSYPLRWTVATITGVDTFVDNHSSGVITKMIFPTANLSTGQAAYNSGDNRVGDVVGWDFISPGEDGSFSIISSNYVGSIPGGTAPNNTYAYAISAMLLAEVEVSPPTIVTQPAAETTVEENRPFSLSVTASGTPLLYQWYREGVGQIAGATFPTYTVAQAALSDSGDYYAVVYNPLSSATSTLAHVAVEADVTPPSIATAYCYPTFDPATQTAFIDQVIIEYNELVDTAPAGGATDEANYLLSDGNTPLSVVLTNDRTVVLKLLAPLAEDTDFTVAVTGVKDLIGRNGIEGGTNNPAPFHTWMRGGGNGLLFEAFNSGADVAVATLTNSPVFPDDPFFRTNLWTFDSRVAFPDNTHEAYGSRTYGVFIPPVSGDWIFYLRTYDRADVYLNPNGLDASGKQFLVSESTGNDPHDYQKLISSPVRLQGGRAYYIEGLQQANAGTDYIKVVARLAGTGMPPLGLPDTDIDWNTIGGSMIGFPLAPRDLGGALTLVQDVQDVTAEENHSATFSVVVANSSGLPMFYQWTLNDVEIPGAIGPTYTIPKVTLADDGSRLRVRVVKIGNSLESGEAVLSVVADTSVPTVVAVHGSFVPNKVTVSFSELMDPTSAQDQANYALSDGITLASDPVLDATGTNAVLTLSTPLAVNGVYSITVRGVMDLANANSVAEVTLTLYGFVWSRGFLRFDYFGGLSTTENSLDATLLADPRYPDNPDQRYFLTAFNSRTVFPTDSHEGYGAHVQGLFVPPVSGNYFFYLQSDDSSRLYLNPTGTDPGGEILLTEEVGCCNLFPTNSSTLQALTAGQSYAIDAVMKEGTGGDYIQVAAQLDTDPTDPHTVSPIAGALLSTLADPAGSSVTITQQPASVLAATLPVTVSFTVGARSTYADAPNTQLVYVWQRDDGAGFQDILGASGQTYTFTAGPADAGAQFRCLVFGPGASATSDPARLVAPHLTIGQDGTKVTVSWSLAVVEDGFLLQSATTVPAATWTTIPSSQYQTNGGTVSIEVTLPPGDPNLFFRLRKE